MGMKPTKLEKRRLSRNYKFLDEARELFPGSRSISRRQVYSLTELNEVLLKQNRDRRLGLNGIAWDMEWLSSTLAALADAIEKSLDDESAIHTYANAKTMLVRMRQATAGLGMESLVAGIEEEPLLVDIAREYTKEAAHLTFLISESSNFEDFKDRLEAWSIHWFGIEGDDDLEVREEEAWKIWNARCDHI